MIEIWLLQRPLFGKRHDYKVDQIYFVNYIFVIQSFYGLTELENVERG